MPPGLRPACTLLVAIAALAGCGDATSTDGSPTIVVTTDLLGDVVEHVVGEAADVIVVMPQGADPHDFEASARQVDELQRADAIVASGGGLEHGLEDIVAAAAADGAPVFSAFDSLALRGPSASDPHFFTDPVLMRRAVESMRTFLANVDGVDVAALERSAADYLDRLTALDEFIEAELAVIPSDARVFVTSHDVFGHFAARYDFTVLGSLVGATTDAAPNARDLAALADEMRAAGVTTIFSSASEDADLAETLAAEVGDVAVVSLFAESLGEAGSDATTYVDMMRTNAMRIAAALGREA